MAQEKSEKDALIDELERGQAFDAFLEKLPEDKREVFGHVIRALLAQEVDFSDDAVCKRSDTDGHLEECAHMLEGLAARFRSELDERGENGERDPYEPNGSQATALAVRGRVGKVLDAGLAIHATRFRKTDGIGDDESVAESYQRLRSLAGLSDVQEDPAMGAYYDWHISRS